LTNAELAPSRVVFIGGSGRSGSTLIERLLGELPQICNVGEVVHLWERGLLRGESCGCGVPLPACPFWVSVGEAAFGGWSNFDVEQFLAIKKSVDRNRHIPRLAACASPAALDRDARGQAAAGRRRYRPASWHLPTRLDGVPTRAACYAATYARLYAAISKVSGCPVVVDSSKHASLAFCLRQSGDIDLRVLHIVRDSRAVAYSWAKQVRRPEATGSSGEYMPTLSPAGSALLWDVLNLGLGLLAARGEQLRMLRYEDFLADPPRAMAALAAFACGPGDFADVIAGFLTSDRANLSATHTASGNPMRFATGSMALRADDEWRAALPAADRAIVSALTLPLLARYGYLRRQAPAAR
jgi:Sulfotransferase domain